MTKHDLSADEPLSAAPADASEPVADAEDFDVADWLSGVRPTRRAVRLYPRGDLVAGMEDLAQRIEQLPDGPEVDALIDEAEALRAEFYASGRLFVVEARSPEWGTELEKQCKADGLDAQETLWRRLAAQTVIPTISAEQVATLYETAPGEAAKLINAVNLANAQVAETGVAQRDFSQRRSGNRRTSKTA